MAQFSKTAMANMSKAEKKKIKALKKARAAARRMGVPEEKLPQVPIVEIAYHKGPTA